MPQGTVPHLPVEAYTPNANYMEDNVRELKRLHRRIVDTKNAREGLGVMLEMVCCDKDQHLS